LKEEHAEYPVIQWSDGFIVNLGQPEYKPEDDLDLRSNFPSNHQY